jgi:diaminohydroxyphosphoribosylaminopyrimidine deaminase/5-amino-6-(5-phosphoribosylamino)uracil reductase
MQSAQGGSDPVSSGIKPYDTAHMRRAIEIAAGGRGSASPNPMVGSVIVSNGAVVGEGWHRRPGEPHAEVLAIRAAGESARGGELYVNLEPCAHHGRTPPCVEAIAAAGIRRVVAAMRDPDPRVNGRGISRLAEAGILVDEGLLGGEAARLNETYLRWRSTGRPFLTLKMALSLDGRMATGTGDSRWISGESSRRRVHRMRAESDAVMIGIGTLLADDPLLTARCAEDPGCRQPLRVVVDGHLRTPTGSRMLAEPGGGKVVIFAREDAEPARAARLEEAGAEVILLPGSGGGVDLAALLALLGARDVTSLLVEGGPRLHSALLGGGLADRATVFVAPVFIGGPLSPGPFDAGGVPRVADALRLADVEVERFDDDVMVTGRLPCQPTWSGHTQGAP